MLEPQLFLDACVAHGIRFVVGVPCSLLAPLINRLLGQSAIRYVAATNEGEAVGIAVGASLAGVRAAVICQNSGLGNTVNPLTSLAAPFRVPLLLVCTWRGRPGTHDEPEHRMMGRVTKPLLDLLDIRHEAFPASPEALRTAMANAIRSMEQSRRSYCLLLASDTLEPAPLPPPADRPAPLPGEATDLRDGSPAPTRLEVLQALLDLAPETAAWVSTTGRCSRELFTLRDRAQHFYLVGSMGCASAVGLGIALHARGPVVVVDGDGAALMHLGNLATIGALAPANLLHVVLDNGSYESTGGQPIAAATDFARVARGVNYRHAIRCDSLAGLRRAWSMNAVTNGPALLHVRIAGGSLAGLGRPTLAPHEVAHRFSAFLEKERQRGATHPTLTGRDEDEQARSSNCADPA